MGSHPSQEGATGISVNSSPLMTVKAAGGTQPPELLALIALCHTFQGSSPGLIGDRWVLLSLIRERCFFENLSKMHQLSVAVIIDKIIPSLYNRIGNSSSEQMPNSFPRGLSVFRQPTDKTC